MHATTTLNPLPRRKPVCAFGLVFALVAALLILVGHSAPSFASSPDYSAFWGEICASGDETDPQNQDHNTCEHCDLCLAQTGIDLQPTMRGNATAASFRITPISFQSGQSLVVTRVEQYWAATRGPPLNSKEKNMIDHSVYMVSKRGVNP